MIAIWFDGCCDGTPYGSGGIGAVIEKDGEVIHTISDCTDCIRQKPPISSNLAEYLALHNALTYLVNNGLTADKVIVYGDSNLVIKQMGRKWRIKKGIYKNKALETKELLKSFASVSLYWIPRADNSQADKLANVGMRKGRRERRRRYVWPPSNINSEFGTASESRK